MKTLEQLKKAVKKLIDRELKPNYYRVTDEHKLLILQIIREVLEEASNEE